ncbi:FecR domain-containing protein [Rhizobacter sp. Root1221]|uniref:FecR domain-containing protein n=1 Tax=Rhizobacter sp. Root1221 TaxID=1736433 RepID=UPI0006F50A9D|nr:FecR domain-containing protein [Rhizobacter sp. Root1221]KQV96905.1 hypothetical protein ASC87_24595 [Rhizobacter sp. Root1221]
MSRTPWLLALAFSAPAWAAAEDTVPYRVQRGDTLYGVAERLLERPADWAELARLNRVRDPNRLSPGRELRLPVARLRGVEQPAVVVYVRGTVTVVMAPGTGPKALAAGDVLGERATVTVGTASFATLRLHDGSVLHVQAGTVVSLQRLRAKPGGERRETVMQLDKGRVDSTVTPQPTGSRFDVRTPLAVTGVRGTRFGVTVGDGGRRVLSDVVEGRVAVSVEGLAETAVPAGEGAVMSAASRTPVVRPLLPAPGITTPLVERLPFAVPVAAVDGAVAYRVQLAEDDAFTRVRVSAETPLPIETADLPDGTYMLSVRAVDRDGLLGAETVAPLRVKTTPVPPLAQFPAAHQVAGPGPLDLRCTDVPGAAFYRMEVLRLDGVVVRQDSPADRCVFRIDVTEPGDYRWRVATVIRAGDGSDDRGPFSDPSVFTIVPAPVAPEPVVDGADGTAIHWQGAAGERYELQVAEDLAFTRIVVQSELTEPSARLDLPSGCEPHYLRLKTLRADGLRSAFSAPRRVGSAGGLCTSDGAPVAAGAGGRVDTPVP